MEDEILDYFESEFDENTRIVAIKYFYFETEARLYAARLREASIASFISNTNVSTALALGEGGIGLHIKEADVQEASRIIAQLEAQKRAATTDRSSYHDIDLDEIQYMKKLDEDKVQKDKFLLYGIITIIILLVIRALLRGSAWVEIWRDAF